MKILYAVQGTGNGHVSRAREIIPLLQDYGDVDVLLSGTQAEIELPVKPRYQISGLGFVFGKKGGIDFQETWRQFHFQQFFRDVRDLPVNDYDFVIQDFEPVTAWACKVKKKKCIAMSHQSAYLSKKVPVLKGFHWGKIIMNNYAPANHSVGFHFKKYDDHVYTPVIRSEIRRLQPADEGHYTVYLPAFSDEFILEHTAKHPKIKWHIFSKKNSIAYTCDHAEVFPIDNDLFTKSLELCTGLLTGGGFEGPAEALFLGKKLLTVPMKSQFEQQCNALAMAELGVPVIWFQHEFAKILESWIHSDKRVAVHYPDETKEIIKKIVGENIFQV